eukprot:15150290-Alexandrium_andersonii.AAC.1
MSASLVGSEMCIRDSARPSSATRTLPLPSRAAWAAARAAASRSRPSGSVSYTHLTLPTICSV